MQAGRIVFLSLISVLTVVALLTQFLNIPHTPVPTLVQENQPTMLPEKTTPLTAAQKIAQLLAISLTLKNEVASEAAQVQKIQELHSLQPGFLVLFGKSITFTTAKTATDQIAALPIPIPIAIAVDHEGGTVQRLSGTGFTPVDSWDTLCQTSPETRKEIFTKSADELKTAGIDMVLGPVVDSASSSSKILGNRLCRGTTLTLLQSAAEVIEIYQRAGITSVLKHYPGIGSVTTDLHRAYSEVTDAEHEMPIFHTLLTNYPTAGVMTAHAGLPGSNLPCSLSADCISLLLQYPDALIITDDLDMKATLQDNFSTQSEVLTQLTQQAIEAKNTVILLGPDVSFETVQIIVSELSARYTTDADFAATVDASLAKIARWKQQRL